MKQYWEIQRDRAKSEKDLLKKHPEIGKIVKYDGEYGVVLYRPDIKFNLHGLVVRWDTKKKEDFEQFGFFDYEYIDNYEFKYINKDGSLKHGS